MQLYRDNSSGGASALSIRTKNSDGNYVRCGYFSAKLEDTTPAAEYGQFEMYTMNNGSPFRLFFDYSAKTDRTYLRGNVGINDTAPDYRLDVNGDINTTGVYRVDDTQVVTNRQTGWAAATGTATRTTFATGTVTLEQLAQRVKALVDDLLTHGLIGA